MMKRMMPFLAVALIVSACESGAPDDEATTGESGQGAASAPAAASARPAAAESYDLRFIDTIKAHHEHGIQMAQMAVQKASSAEVREMAQKMVADQQRDNAELASWRGQWFAGAADAMDMSLPGASSMNMDMSSLQSATGHDFDHAFLEMMVPHHEGAIAMSRDAAAKAEHDELRRKAQEMADKQQREIEDIKKMQSSMAAH
jgi:uncharacterized protein (DUF305 family)